MFKIKNKVYNQRLQNVAKNSIVLCSFLLGFSLLANGQGGFDNTYHKTNNLTTVNAKGKSILNERCDYIVTVNSAENQNGNYDFQISYIDANTGAIISSYSYGDPNGNDYCNSLCKSATANNYILCGKSENNNMLVMEVKANGVLVWSEEIIYPGKESEAITVLPFKGGIGQGITAYMVVGNTVAPNGTNSQIAVARLDLNGSTAPINGGYANEYPIPNSTNVVTDAVMLEENSAHDLYCAITGNHFNPLNPNAEMFTTQIRLLLPGGPTTSNTQIYSSIYPALMNPQIVDDPYDPSIGGNNTYDYLVACTQDNNLTTVIKRINNNFPVTPASSTLWQNTFDSPIETGVKDMIILDNDDISILGYESQSAGLNNPFTLDLSPIGTFLSQTSHNAYNQQGQVIIPSGITEGCFGLVHNGISDNVNAPWINDIKVTQVNSSNPSNCSDPVIRNLIPILPFFPPGPSSQMVSLIGFDMPYNVQSGPRDHAIFDCQGANLRPANAGDVATDINSTINTTATNWVFPNPVSTQLHLVLSDEQETIVIYNNLGQIVVRKKEAGSITLDVAELPTGMYTIERTNNAGKVLRKKLIIE